MNSSPTHKRLITRIERRHWLMAAVIAAAMAMLLWWQGRPPICTCGTIRLWIGAVQSAENSQQIADWYTPSHIIHGFVFYTLGWLFLRRNLIGERYIAAILIEAGWELLENSQFIIDRYREATFAFGYNGDSVLNSLTDLGWMTLGFMLARRLPVWVTIAIAIFFESLTLWIIRGNLALNVLMLIAPIDAIKAWQGRV
jgi:hypothetical protein